MAAEANEDDAQRYHCSNCHCDITMRLKCAQCTDIDLCLECFASGAEIGQHKKDHRYQLIDDGSFFLLNEHWGAVEEVLLLDGIEQDGLGNWEDAASNLLTKTPEEIQRYYHKTYIDGPIGQGIIPSNFHATVLENCGGKKPPSPPAFTPVRLEHAEQMELGYLPYRDDFEREYDNTAESMITGLATIGSDDESVYCGLQLSQVDMFNRVLKERQLRKNIARQHNLIAGKQRQNVQKRKFSKDERELRSKFRPFARLMESEEYDKFISSLKREKQLKHRIKELIRYRKHGITRLEDCLDCEKIKDKRKSQENTNPAVSTRTAEESTAADHDDTLYTPGVSLLSTNERSLCQTASIKPLKFLNLKVDIMKESALRRYGIPKKHKIPNSFKPEQKQRLKQYFSKTNWL